MGGKKWIVFGGMAAVGTALYLEAMTSLIVRRRSLLLNRIWKKSPPWPDDENTRRAREEREALEETPMEKLRLKSRDGAALEGLWYPAENPRRTLVMAHGWHGGWQKDFGSISAFLHEEGCNLLFIKQRCHDESQGNFISFGALERWDVVKWLETARQKSNGLPLYLCGLSMGASTVLLASQLLQKGRVSGIIADCGYTSPEEIISLCLKKVSGHEMKLTLAAVDRICRRRGGFGLKGVSTLTAMENNQIPTLFIHGDADDFVPMEMTLRNFAACAGPKDLLIVHGAGHGLSYLVARDAYQQKLREFFKKYDEDPGKEI